MPANTSPIFTLVPVLTTAQVTAANTNRDGTGTIVDIVTGATNGTRIEIITIEATGTTTAGMVRLYVHDGSNTRLWQEVAVTSATPSATVKAFTAELTRFDGRPLLVLPNTWKLRASTHNAETFNVIAQGGDF